MVIAQGIDKKVGICDCETLAELFDVGVYDPDTGEWIEFEVSKYKNELDKFVKWYLSKPVDYLVTFNGIGFDQQVLEYIVDNYQKWYDLTNLEICAKIAQFAQDIIENQRYGIFLPYKDHQFSIPALDVFRIHHFDNEAKRTSLKWCAFMLNMDVEEMPIHHLAAGLTEEDVKLVRSYRRNDVLVTLGLLYITLGEVDKVLEINGGNSIEELKDYKGKNKIQDRFDVRKETGLECLNWSDVKIGEEWNKADYKRSENIKDDSILFPKKVKHPYGKKFKQFFPPSIDFTTKSMNDFVQMLGNQYVTGEKQEFPVKIGNTTYTVAKGGLHSNEKYRRVIPPEGMVCRDGDVGSQYPNSIVKLNVFPDHLKPIILDQFKEKIAKRIKYKSLATQLKKQGKEEEARPYSSVQEMLKLCSNGGFYGKLGQPGSFLESSYELLRVCIGNQIEILMLIEMMEEAGFQVISGNTDGIVTIFPADKEDIYNQICLDWEKKVGNIIVVEGTSLGKLEYTDFLGLWQESINHYIAKKDDGKVKKKGRFATEFEMNKNKSKRVIPLALEEYFINGKDPIKFIKEHNNIFDFCIAKKASRDMYYEEQWEENKQICTKRHKKLVRYYVSVNGNVLYKRGFDYKGAPVNNHCEAANDIGQPKVTYFNKWEKRDDYQIDYSYYILQTLERIDKIEKTNKAKMYVESLRPQIQGSLF